MAKKNMMMGSRCLCLEDAKLWIWCGIRILIPIDVRIHLLFILSY